MNLIDAPLTVNQYSRPGRNLSGVRALVIHWTAAPNQRAHSVRSYYEQRALGKDGFGSAHYAIDINGDVVRMIPEAEIAYHCGSTSKDPASGKIYTDLARQKFGKFATDWANLSPNLVTLGVEHCVVDSAGLMTAQTIQASIELSADICRRYSLNPLTDLVLHKEVVGWKDCHRYFVNNPGAWADYKSAVAGALA